MIAGYILTGGKNRRMNGNKKLFLTYKGMPFYQHIISAFCNLPIIYLSVDATDAYQKLHMPMIVDLYPDIGPIGGIYSGLMQCKESALFVTACDMPLVGRKIVEQVCEEYQKHPKKITIVKSGECLQPLFGIYPKTVLPLLEQMIAQKRYRMMDLFAQTDIGVIQLENDSQAMRNINTIDEYQNLQGEGNGTKTKSF